MRSRRALKLRATGGPGCPGGSGGQWLGEVLVSRSGLYSALTPQINDLCGEVKKNNALRLTYSGQLIVPRTTTVFPSPALTSLHHVGASPLLHPLESPPLTQYFESDLG